MSDGRKGKVLAAARDVFLRYGYRRVSMGDIAAAAGMSRPALYLVFKSKEEIFVGVFTAWVDEMIAEIESGMAELADPGKKIAYAFEAWAVRPFEMASSSPEARELLECSFDFAQEPLKQAYARFEAAIAPVLDALWKKQRRRNDRDAAMVAHVLASAVRGFKQTAETRHELRELIAEFLALSLNVRGSP